MGGWQRPLLRHRLGLQTTSIGFSNEQLKIYRRRSARNKIVAVVLPGFNGYHMRGWDFQNPEMIRNSSR